MNHVEAVEKFLEQQGFDADHPVAVSLAGCAKALDVKYSSAASGEFLRAIRYIEEHTNPTDKETGTDPLLTPAAKTLETR